MKPLLLASRSPIRAKMLSDAGVSFEVCPAPFDEDAAKRAWQIEGVGASELAGRLAIAKAQAATAEADQLVLGADQTLEQDGRVFDKPATLTDLREQLLSLEGRSHVLHSAAALVRDGQTVWSGLSSVRMDMRPLSPPAIDRYVRENGADVLGCVGGYQLEGRGVRLFDAIEGEYFAVLGLPLLGILRALRTMAADDI